MVAYSFVGQVVLNPDGSIGGNLPGAAWTADVGGTDVTGNLKASDGVTVANFTTNAAGVPPHIYGPDGVTTLWYSFAGGPRFPVTASDATEALLQDYTHGTITGGGGGAGVDSTARAAASAAQAAAAQAQSTASTAQTTASSALTTAGNASTAATSAQTTAGNAQTTATAANSTATNALNSLTGKVTSVGSTGTPIRMWPPALTLPPIGTGQAQEGDIAILLRAG